ncbi:GNAT family N-acetyltransferase [Paraburkholderia bryophila]
MLCDGYQRQCCIGALIRKPGIFAACRCSRFVTRSPLRFGQFGHSQPTTSDHRMKIPEAIYLHPSRYGQGIGALLIEHACRSLGEIGYRNVSLWVLTSNCRARTFYERAGFEGDDQTRQFELGGAVLWEIRYQRPLDGCY